MLDRRLILVAAISAALLAPSGTAFAALPQQGGLVDLAAPGANPVLSGAGGGDTTGAVVAAAGDVNGDGLPDSIVAAPLADSNGRADSGSVYVVFGRASLASLDLRSSSTTGFRIDGGATGDRFGTAVAAAGDVNGDGYADIVAGAPQADPSGRSNAGAGYVIYGAPGSAGVDVAALGTRGFPIDGAAAGDLNGTAVAGGTDMSGDGRPDVAVVAASADPTFARRNAGSAYVVTSRTATDLAAGGWAMRADAPLRDDAMSAVAFVPGPGLAVGAPAADPNGRAGAGSAWVVPGRSDGTTIDLTSSTARVNGAVAGDALGTVVRSLPGQLAVGAPGADPSGRANAGSLLMVDPTSPAAAPLLRIDGGAASDAVGTAVAAGSMGLVVGAPRADSNDRTDNGALYILPGGLAGTVNLGQPPTGTVAARGAASGDRAGTDVAPIGDANGDGHDDLAVGAPYNDQLLRSDSGASYTMLGWGGAAFSYPATLDAAAQAAIEPLAPTVTRRTGAVRYAIAPAVPAGLTFDAATGVLSGTPAAMTDGAPAYTVTMTDLSGSTVAPLTIRVGPAAGACTNNLLLTSNLADVVTGSDGGDTIRGNVGDDHIDGAGGADCLFGDGDQDVLSGSAGNDELHGGKADDSLGGGDGDDQVWGDEDDDVVTGDAGADRLDGGVGSDRLDGGTGNDQLAGAEDGDSLDGGSGDDAIDGGPGHDFLNGADGADVVHGDSDDDLVNGGDGADELFGDDQDDFLNGGRGDDRVHGGLRPDELHGGEGSDLLWGDDGNDLVDGETGDDQLWGGAGFDHLTGADGSDRLSGDDGADILEGGAGSDVLDGGTGNDRLFDGGGNDVLRGGDGNDVLTVGKGPGSATVDGGAGNDVIDVTNGRRDVAVCGAGKDTVVADRTDKLIACEKKTIAPASKAKKAKKKKRKKSRRSRR